MNSSHLMKSDRTHKQKISTTSGSLELNSELKRGFFALAMVHVDYRAASFEDQFSKVTPPASFYPPLLLSTRIIQWHWNTTRGWPSHCRG